MKDNEKAEPPLPKTIGGYNIVGGLGQGAFVNAYQATNADGTFVVRVLRKDTDMPKAEEHFRNEADILQIPALANAQQIARYIGQGEDPAEGFFIVTEFVEGPSLQELMPDDGMPQEEALEIATTICRALMELAIAGIVHGDLKPNNIMMERLPEGVWRAKIIDFNTAHLSGKLPHGYVDKGPVVGTPRFMAPEQARGETLDDRTDVFALGCILCMMLTGKCVAATNDQMQTLILRGSMTEIPKCPTGISEDVWDVLKDALHPFKEKRLQAVSLELLLNLLVHRGTMRPSDKEIPITRSMTRQPETSQEAPHPHSARNKYALGAIAGVLLALVGGSLLMGRSTTATIDDRRATQVVATTETRGDASTPQDAPAPRQRPPRRHVQPRPTPPHPQPTPRVEPPHEAPRRPSTTVAAHTLPPVVGARQAQNGRGYTIPGPSHWNEPGVANSRHATCAGLRAAGMERATGESAARFHAFCDGH